MYAIRSYYAAFAHFLSGVDRGLVPAPTTVVVGKPGADDTTAMISSARNVSRPGAHLLFASEDRSSRDRCLLEKLAPFVSDMGMREGRATAYVCQERSCSSPVTRNNFV